MTTHGFLNKPCLPDDRFADTLESYRIVPYPIFKAYWKEREIMCRVIGFEFCEDGSTVEVEYPNLCEDEGWSIASLDPDDVILFQAINPDDQTDTPSS